jgi:hypothetical protein
MASREVKVAILGDPSSLQRALRTADTGVSSFASRMQSVGSRMRSVGSTLTRSLTLPLIGFGIVAARELSDSETKLAQTQAVIESTGGAARKTVHDITALSASLSEMSSVDDEDIQGLANTLLTFRNIAGPTFDEATEAALNLSVAMGTDLQAAGIQIGKALNDPIRGLTSLTRVGVTFTQQQRDAIQAMVFFGDTAGAQRIILEELNAEFGGSAEALGGTFTGRLNKVKNRFEEMSASILEDLLPVLEDLADDIEDLADAYDNLTPKQQKVVAGLLAFAFAIGPISSVLGFLASGIGAVVGVMGAMAGALGVSTGLFALLALAVIALGVEIYILATNWDRVRDFASSALNSIVANVPGARGALDGLKAAVQFVSAAVGTLIGWVRQLAGMALGGITAAFQSVLSLIQAATSSVFALVDAISGAISAAASLPSSIPSLLGGGPRRVGESSSSRPMPVTADDIGRAVARHLGTTVQPVYSVERS